MAMVRKYEIKPLIWLLVKVLKKVTLLFLKDGKKRLKLLTMLFMSKECDLSADLSAELTNGTVALL